MIRNAIYDLGARDRHRWFGHRDDCTLPNWGRSWASSTAPRLRDNGARRWLAATGVTKEAALLLFNSVPVTASTICRISFVCAQAWIEAE
jgi:hypothetical protein